MKTNRQYKACFILDTRGYDQPIETLVENLKNAIHKTGSTIEKAVNLGRKDFIRVTDRGHTGDIFVEIAYTGAPESPQALQNRLRLDKTVKRLQILCI